jgi:hypothetical protein
MPSKIGPTLNIQSIIPESFAAPTAVSKIGGSAGATSNLLVGCSIWAFGPKQRPIDSYLLPRSGKTMAQITLSPNETMALEKSHIRATAPGIREGITTVSPRAHFRISSEAFASLSRKPADTGRQ